MSNKNWIDEAGHRPGARGTAVLGLLIGAFFVLCLWCMEGMLAREGVKLGEGPLAYLGALCSGVGALFAARWWQDRPLLTAEDVAQVQAYAWNSAGMDCLSVSRRTAAQITYGDVRRAARAHINQVRREEDASKRRQACLAMDLMMTHYQGMPGGRGRGLNDFPVASGGTKVKAGHSGRHGLLKKSHPKVA